LRGETPREDRGKNYALIIRPMEWLAMSDGACVVPDHPAARYNGYNANAPRDCARPAKGMTIRAPSIVARRTCQTWWSPLRTLVMTC
jgi:hypothetical protein